MSKITYTDKVALNINPDIADVNKCNATDLNEIKSVVNTNDDNVGDLTQLTTTDKSSVVNAINEVNDINIMTATLQTDKELDTTSNYTSLQLEEFNKVGNKLSIALGGYNSQGIKIGAGIRKVLVSASATIANTHDAVLSYNMYIYKNTSIVKYSRVQINFSTSGTDGITETVTIAPILLDAEEDDVFSIRIYKTSQTAPSRMLASSNRTHLTVQVIE